MRLLVIFLVVLTGLVMVAPAEDWPQWRGPNRDGVVPSFREPKSWPERLKPVWKVAVGIGHSTPVVVGGKVYQHSRLKDREVVSSLDLETGKVLWEESYPAPFRVNPAATGHGEGPKSTPVAESGRLFTLGISGILSCLDLQTGKVKWRKDFSGEFPETWPDFGTAMSPVVDRGLVIAHVGGNTQGALAAFSVETGAEKWSWKGDGPAYASPIVVDLGGTRQVVTQSRENLVGVSAATGDLLWKIPFTTQYVQNIVTPVIYQQTLIFSGIEKGTMAIRAVKRGNTWSTEKIWHNQDVAMYMNSPVVSGDYLYGMSHKKKGQYFCLDARTGATLWTSEGREGDNAAVVLGGDVLLLLNNEGNLLVARRDPKAYQVLHRYTVAESPTWAHPVVAGPGVLIKDQSSLALWSWQ